MLELSLGQVQWLQLVSRLQMSLQNSSSSHSVWLHWCPWCCVCLCSACAHWYTSSNGFWSAYRAKPTDKQHTQEGKELSANHWGSCCCPVPALQCKHLLRGWWQWGRLVGCEAGGTVQWHNRVRRDRTRLNQIRHPRFTTPNQGSFCCCAGCKLEFHHVFTLWSRKG